MIKSQLKIFLIISLTIISNYSYAQIRKLRTHDTITISFIGDVMQHGKQLRSALIAGEDPNNADSYNYSNVFKYIEPTLKSSDIAIANMEFPIGTPPYRGYPTFSAPESIIKEAKRCGINLSLLANNHLLDMGAKGFRRTLELYNSIGMNYTGAYLSAEEQEKNNPKLLFVKGIKIAFINFTYGTNGFPIPAPYIINTMDSIKVKEAINRAKEKGANLIIALPHWGEEYKLNPNSSQKRWANMLFREGVEIIIGSHPHTPQEAYIDNNKIIFYSLGNYISNQSIPDYTQLELLVTIKISINLITKEHTILNPEYQFLWCFKKGEFIDDYTVVPIKDLIEKRYPIKDTIQFNRMLKTYNSFINKNLIKNARDN